MRSIFGHQGWQEEVGERKAEVRQLRMLTDVMVAGHKRSRAAAEEK